MKELRLTSCMSEIADPFCRELVGYLSDQLNWEVVFVDDISWQERMEKLFAGEIHAGWVCGLAYVNFCSSLCHCEGAQRPKQSPSRAGGLLRRQSSPHNDGPIELLAAPVMQGERYKGRPVYFSDVIVRRDSPFQSFGDLLGARWAYNEPGSLSGYLVMLHHLARMGESIGFFSVAIESGAHTASIQMVRQGQADVAAIDSTAIDQYIRLNPGVCDDVRVVESLGPNPIPPWVVSRSLADNERELLIDVFTGMYANPRGRAILSNGLFNRFVPVEDADYDPIRRVVSASQENSFRT